MFATQTNSAAGNASAPRVTLGANSRREQSGLSGPTVVGTAAIGVAGEEGGDVGVAVDKAGEDELSFGVDGLLGLVSSG